MTAKAIQILRASSSGLMPEWEHVQALEIAAKWFSEGAFGEIYNCVNVNGIAPAVPLVVKLFKQDAGGNAERGYETICKLQPTSPRSFQLMRIHGSSCLLQVIHQRGGIQ